MEIRKFRVIMNNGTEIEIDSAYGSISDFFIHLSRQSKKTGGFCEFNGNGQSVIFRFSDISVIEKVGNY